MIAAEKTHWYSKQGAPVYEVKARNGEMRPATLADARKLDLLPSVSLVIDVAAKPGLEIYKQRQILMSALTLPMNGQNIDDFAERVIADSKEQARKAAQRGTDLHAAIEDYIRGQTSLLYQDHISALVKSLRQQSIDIEDGKAEHSFACDAGYGGKVDWHSDDLLLDFKTKESIDEKIKPYDNHLMQCAAYAYGLGLKRAGNVFIGIADKQVRVFLYEYADLADALAQFRCLLEYWQLKNRFGNS